MSAASRREEYLRKAEEAEEQMKLVADNPVAKEAWHRIILNYLELAEMARRSTLS